MALERQNIVETALALLEGEGLEGLTMRRLADALQVQAPSLYWHFPGKQALLDDMADALLADVAVSNEPGNPYRATLRRIANELRVAFSTHRDGAQLFASSFVQRENGHRLAAAIVAALTQAGFDTPVAKKIEATLFQYVLGFVLAEQAAAKHHEANDLDIAADDQPDFAFGLDLIVIGIGEPPLKNVDKVNEFMRALRAMD